MSDVQLLVIAKAPVAGRSKTRLSPPCSPEEAAWLAEAALACTLQAVALTPASRRVLVLDGEPGAWMPDGFQVLPQRGAGLDERLAAAFEDAGAPSLLIGMDTPSSRPPCSARRWRRSRPRVLMRCSDGRPTAAGGQLGCAAPIPPPSSAFP